MQVARELSRHSPQEETAAGLRAEFDRVGAIIVRGALCPDEVSALRERLHGLYAPFDARPGKGYVKLLSPATIFRRPDVLMAAMSPRIVAALSAILEPGYAVLPDFQTQRNSFPFLGARDALHLFGLIGQGWHHDSGDERANPYLFEEDYRMVKCGLYLQDNTEAIGGGIDIAPGAHRRFFLTGRPALDYYLQRIRQNVILLANWRSLDIKAGDFVAFDSWLPHRGTLPRRHLQRANDDERRHSYVSLPPEQTKFTIYYNASRRRLGNTYLEHCLKRGRRELDEALAGRPHGLFFGDFPGLRYPQDYPPAMVALIERHGLHMSQLEGKDLADAIVLRDRALSSDLFHDYMPAAEPTQS